MRGAQAWRIEGDGPVEVARDANGVPHISARSEADAYRALGYCHVRDRALQMLLVRIVGCGRASELLGPRTELLEFDRFFRRLNLGSDTEQEVLRLPPADRGLAEAYCDGVNQALAQRRPWELRMLRYRPEPWTVADVILVSRVIGYVALAQTEGDMERLIVELVQGGVPVDHLRELFPGLLDEVDPSLLERVTLGQRLIPASLRWGSIAPTAAASNSWALAPSKTASGEALLASDPHLEVNRLPALWYEVVLQWPERFCIAATMPGLPGAIIGRTNDLAWGITYSCMDTHDSWIEDCRAGCYRRVDSDGTERWIPFRRRVEVVKRKGKSDVSMTFFENDHGVLDGDPFEHRLTLTGRWSAAAGTGARSLAAIFEVARARDVPDGMRALGTIETAWNWILADASGRIGYQMSGLMPLRRAGHKGLFPLPGWDPANDWSGFADPEDLPRALDPEEGFLANANDDVNHLGKLTPVNLPMGSHRAARIRESLARRDNWTVADTHTLQLDVLSRQAQRFMEVLRPLLPGTQQGRVLHRWDCRYDVDSRGAYLFECFYRQLIKDVFGRACGEDIVRFLVEETGIVGAFYQNFDRILLDDDSVWWRGRRRDEVFERVAAAALEASPRRWGEQQSFVMRNIFWGGRLPSWLGFDQGPMELPGARATVRQGQVFRAYGRRVAVAASIRFATDFGEAAAYTALPGGPSDRRVSRWYRSDIARWSTGAYKRLSSNER